MKLIKEVRDFNLKHIFECGQCFRWEEEPDGSYTGTALGRTINLNMEKAAGRRCRHGKCAAYY